MSNTKNLYKKALEPNHGGPAFPRVGHSHPQDIEPEHWIKGNEGMTLRDYFAGLAMQGALANASITIEGVDANFAIVHRAVFNLCHRQPITYMGPETRTAEDAQYDTLWHSIAAKDEVHERVLFRPDAVQYIPRFPHAPFVFAVVFEALVCSVCLFTALEVH